MREDRAMSLKDRAWYPYASAAGWAAVVFALVLVNSGSILLAVVLAAVVGVITWRLDGGRRDARNERPPS